MDEIADKLEETFYLKAVKRVEEAHKAAKAENLKFVTQNIRGSPKIH